MTSPLRIGLDATPAGIAGGERSGVYQYIVQLTHAMASLAPAADFRLLYALPRSRHDESIRAAMRSVGAANASPRRARLPIAVIRRWRLPIELWTGGVDVFHALAHLAPRTWRAGLVVTVHDMAYCHDRGRVAPSGLDPDMRRHWERRRRFFDELSRGTADTVQRAQLVITVSHATASDLTRELGVPAAKIRVVYNGVRPDVMTWREGPTGATTRQRYGLDGAYGLYVGVLDPNKNLEVLFDAFAAFLRRAPGRRLAIAGADGPFAARLRQHAHARGLGDAVRWLGYVPDADLPSLYSGADWLAMPSPLEGFGLPVLEAMALGTPVIAAAGGALPEVVGDAGILAAPDSAAAFADAMRLVTEDPGVRTALMAAGRTRAAKFTWERAAADTLAAYAEVARQ